MRNWLFILLIGLVLGSCCTKQECIDSEPNVNIYAKTKDSLFQDYFYYHLLDGFGRIQGASSIYFKKGIAKISFPAKERVFEVNRYILNIRNDSLNINDTITDIFWKVNSTSYDCNDCVIGKDLAKSYNYSNFSMKYNNQCLTKNDTIYLK